MQWKNLIAAACLIGSVAPLVDAQSWVRRETPYAHAMDGPMAYDEARERTVLFDARSRATWGWDGAEWVRQAPANSPAIGSGLSMAYDSARERTVLVGATDSQTAPLAETWEWDGVDWAQRTSALNPPGTWKCEIAYDPSRAKTILFGWPSTAAGETWEWDGTAWTQRTPATMPSRRSGHGMAFDPVRQTILLFGGASPWVQNETWEWDGVNWTQLNPAQSPPANDKLSMTCDPVRNRVVLYGRSTWEWDGSTWHARSGGPAPTGYGTLAYDVSRRRTVLASGWGSYSNRGIALAETWEWDGSVWTDRSERLGPLWFNSGSEATFDSARNRLVLVGWDEGRDTTMDTWEWDGWRWVEPTPAVSPPTRVEFAMAFDASRAHTLLFGGLSVSFPGSALNDTWTWNGAAWTRAQPATSPSARRLHAMAYDAGRGRVVLYGGHAGPTALADTWEWDGNTWMRMQPSHSPPPRAYTTLVYDPARRCCLLSGGTDLQAGPFPPSTVWEWNGVDWTQLYQGTEHVPMTPPVYDTARGQIVGVTPPDLWLFGNVTAADASNSGTPCGSSGGAPEIAGYGRPWLGNSAFGIDLHDLPPSSPAGIVFGLATASIPLGGGCTLYVDSQATVAAATVSGNTSGFAHLPLPIPANRSLLGAMLHAQAVTIDLNGPYFGLSLTGRLELRLGE